MNFNLTPSSLSQADADSSPMTGKMLERSQSWYPVPEDVKQLLEQAIATWEDTPTSEHYIKLALAKAGNQSDVLISIYRYFFYKQNYANALQILNQLLEQLQQDYQIPSDWSQAQPILEQCKHQPEIRLYLSTQSAKGFVLARLGDYSAAQQIATQIQILDPNREFGADLLLKILTTPPDLDEE